MKWQGEIDISPPDEGDRNRSLPARPNRYDRGLSWMPALLDKRPAAYPMPDQPSALSDAHLTALDSIRENATPVGRAWGVVIKSLWLGLLLLVVAIGLMVVFASDWPLPVLLVALIGVVAFLLLNAQELRHSAAGIERHKADLAHDVQIQQIKAHKELAKITLASYLKLLGDDR